MLLVEWQLASRCITEKGKEFIKKERKRDIEGEVQDSFILIAAS